MLYTCDKCGKTRPDQIIDAEHDLVICPECGYARPFKRMPLFGIGGASGSGKTAICKNIAGKLDGVVVLDGDILWGDHSFSPQHPEPFYEYALRVSMNISQSGQAVAIFHAGFGIPDNLENCAASRYFSGIHYLGLYCSDDEIENRLKKRPTTQGEAGQGFINGMKGFNNFFRFYDNSKNEYPPMDKLDTTGVTLDETTDQVAAWIKSKMKGRS